MRTSEGDVNGISHTERMTVALWLVLTGLLMGEDVLVHCRQGKHRSGVFCLLVMVLLMCNKLPVERAYEQMKDLYFARNVKAISFNFEVVRGRCSERARCGCSAPCPLPTTSKIV